MFTFTQKQLRDFSTLIDDRYGLKGLTERLDLAVEMLHYIEKDAFSQRSVQNVTCVLRDITTVFRQSFNDE